MHAADTAFAKAAKACSGRRAWRGIQPAISSRFRFHFLHRAAEVVSYSLGTWRRRDTRPRWCEFHAAGSTWKAPSPLAVSFTSAIEEQPRDQAARLGWQLAATFLSQADHHCRFILKG
jgi:hypothetical protein